MPLRFILQTTRYFEKYLKVLLQPFIFRTFINHSAPTMFAVVLLFMIPSNIQFFQGIDVNEAGTTIFKREAPYTVRPHAREKKINRVARSLPKEMRIHRLLQKNSLISLSSSLCVLVPLWCEVHSRHLCTT